MSPKPGTEVTLVPPTAPADAVEAATADPGQVETIEKEKAKKEKVSLKPHKLPEAKEDKEKKKSWIEIEMVDGEDKPVPGVRYRVTLPDGTADEGTLDDKGFARVEGFEAGGDCKITFPEHDKEAWESA
jgi:hypothetical protein